MDSLPGIKHVQHHQLPKDHHAVLLEDYEWPDEGTGPGNDRSLRAVGMDALSQKDRL